MFDGLGMFLFKNYPNLFFPYYRNFSKKWISFISGITSFVPFSLWDIVLVILIIVLIVTLIKAFKKKKILKWLTNVFLSASIISFVVIYGWMLNHYAPALSTYIGLDVKEYTIDELNETCEYYLTQASKYALYQERDEEYHIKSGDINRLGEIAGKAYLNISDQYEIFKGSSVRVKHFSLIGDYLLYNDIVGMFMPIDGEASVCSNAAYVQLPFYMSHEAAHRLGIASEQEANFAAYLACINNDDVLFKYSGYYMAFSYCFSSLYRENPEMAMALFEKYSDDKGTALLRLDRSDVSELYKKYESPLSEISDQINDTYLKTFSQVDGIKSYGKVTDYLIAEYLKEK